MASEVRCAATCEYHDDRSTRLAKIETRTDNIEAWVAATVKRNDDGHQQILKAIQELRDEMMHSKGAGWMLVKVGAFIVGLAALFGALWKAFK